MPGKYDSKRDEALHRLSLEGWANKSSGDVEAPSGFYARISVDASELEALHDVLSSDFEVGDLDLNDLIGHFLVIEDNQGFVTVEQYTDAPTSGGLSGWDASTLLLSAYAERDRQYSAWLKL